MKADCVNSEDKRARLEKMSGRKSAQSLAQPANKTFLLFMFVIRGVLFANKLKKPDLRLALMGYPDMTGPAVRSF